MEGRSEIKLNQCVFGYDDGHKLLASSVEMPRQVASQLLLMSDLAPGLSTTDFLGYWTGFPLLNGNQFVLMKTWPAPEMPRPGCVWTHAILIDYADIARFENLAVLQNLVERPTIGRLEKYNKYKTFNITSEQNNWFPSVFVDQEKSLLMLRVLYGKNKKNVIGGTPEEYDDVIFSIWSQQWPRLRRSFSFRTASGYISKSTPELKFDIQISFDQKEFLSPFSSDLNTESWEKAVLNDLQQSSSRSEVRRFLWRYGSDIKNGRNHFRFLVETFLSAKSGLSFGAEKSSLLFKVFEHLPDAEDGKLLKEDLLSYQPAKYSLLPASNPIDIINSIFSSDNISPPILSQIPIIVPSIWTTDCNKILSIAEKVVFQNTPQSELLLKEIISLIDSDSFFTFALDKPKIRELLIKAKPELLDSDSLNLISSDILFDLLTVSPLDPILASCLVRRLLPLDSEKIVNYFVSEFPFVTFDVVSANLNNCEGYLERSWLNVIKIDEDRFLQDNFIECAPSVTRLAQYASILGYNNTKVEKLGVLPWCKGLRKNKGYIADLHDDQSFMVFLFSLAISEPANACEIIFENTFEHIHKDLEYSKLRSDMYSIIEKHLPEVYSWERWDKCLRLRKATVSAYLQGKLKPSSFDRLTSNRYLFTQLKSVLNESKQGKAFAKKLKNFMTK